MKCPKCQFENPDDNKFCRKCGAEIILTCSKCGNEMQTDDKFCGKCGQKIVADADEDKAQLTTDSERKHVTVLFSDLSGYTAMSEKLDPEEVKEIMNRVFEQIKRVIQKYEGFIEKFVGDAVMAIFGVPQAHEDDPIRAIRAVPTPAQIAYATLTSIFLSVIVNAKKDRA